MSSTENRTNEVAHPFGTKECSHCGRMLHWTMLGHAADWYDDGSGPYICSSQDGHEVAA